MKGQLRQNAGLALVFTGAILLVVSFLTGLSRVNAVLVAGWLLVTAGIFWHVWQQKQDSKY